MLLDHQIRLLGMFEVEPIAHEISTNRLVALHPGIFHFVIRCFHLFLDVIEVPNRVVALQFLCQFSTFTALACHQVGDNSTVNNEKRIENDGKKTAATVASTTATTREHFQRADNRDQQSDKRQVDD